MTLCPTVKPTPCTEGVNEYILVNTDEGRVTLVEPDVVALLTLQVRFTVPQHTLIAPRSM